MRSARPGKTLGVGYFALCTTVGLPVIKRATLGCGDREEYEKFDWHWRPKNRMFKRTAVKRLPGQLALAILGNCHVRNWKYL